MLLAYLYTRHGRAVIGKASLGILALCCGGLISIMVVDAIRVEADALFIEGQLSPASDRQLAWGMGEEVVPVDAPAPVSGTSNVTPP
jgi:hypothetical protein